MASTSSRSVSVDCGLVMITAGRGLRVFDRQGDYKQIGASHAGEEVLDVRSHAAGRHFVSLLKTGVVSVGRWDQPFSSDAAALRWEDWSGVTATCMDVVHSDSGCPLVVAKTNGTMSSVLYVDLSTKKPGRKTPHLREDPIAVAAVGTNGSFAFGLKNAGVHIYSPKQTDYWNPPSADTMTDLCSSRPSPNILGACFRSGNVTTFDLSAKRQVLKLKVHAKSPAKKMAFSTTSSLLAATGAEDGHLHVIGLDSGRVMKRFNCKAAVTCVTFCPDRGGSVAAGNEAGVVHVWDLRQGKEPVAVIKDAQDGPVNGVAFASYLLPPSLRQSFEPEPETETHVMASPNVLAALDERDIRVSPSVAADFVGAPKRLSNRIEDLAASVAKENSPPVAALPPPGATTSWSPARTAPSPSPSATSPRDVPEAPPRFRRQPIGEARSDSSPPVLRSGSSSTSGPNSSPSPKTASVGSPSRAVPAAADSAAPRPRQPLRDFRCGDGEGAVAPAQSSVARQPRRSGAGAAAAVVELVNDAVNALAVDLVPVNSSDVGQGLCANCSCHRTPLATLEQIKSLVREILDEVLPVRLSESSTAAQGTGRTGADENGNGDGDGDGSRNEGCGTVAAPAGPKGGFTAEQINTLERIVGSMVSIFLHSQNRHIDRGMRELHGDLTRQIAELDARREQDVARLREEIHALNLYGAPSRWMK